jgi:hypothetical protein
MVALAKDRRPVRVSIHESGYLGFVAGEMLKASHHSAFVIDPSGLDKALLAG